jgi:hypothetical protein
VPVCLPSPLPAWFFPPLFGARAFFLHKKKKKRGLCCRRFWRVRQKQRCMFLAVHIYDIRTCCSQGKEGFFWCGNALKAQAELCFDCGINRKTNKKPTRFVRVLFFLGSFETSFGVFGFSSFPLSNEYGAQESKKWKKTLGFSNTNRFYYTSFLTKKKKTVLCGQKTTIDKRGWGFYYLSFCTACTMCVVQHF